MCRSGEDIGFLRKHEVSDSAVEKKLTVGAQAEDYVHDFDFQPSQQAQPTLTLLSRHGNITHWPISTLP